ncbi:hypothetical protein G5V59_26600 [Nocardioides sp. W3-2-3]|uniref:hypothetical protein n=1 Tax=Nocardioides convexus TaxID=2712224 RepID=UPI0024182C16|nr:hypothetical protein [Nocardioides convexus]NHA01979.1 hypothetical protein [Nocardioides convexus]
MSDLTRRTVLGASATGLAATVVGGAVAAPAQAAPARRTGLLARRFTAEHALYRRGRFASRRGSAFWVTGTGVRVSMRLVEVTDITGVSRGSLRSLRVDLPGGPQGAGPGHLHAQPQAVRRDLVVPGAHRHRPAHLPSGGQQPLSTSLDR